MAALPKTSDYRITYLVISVSVLSFSLVQAVNLPVLTELQHHFGTDQPTVTWTLTVYLLTASVATPIVARLADALGKEKLLVFSMTALSLGLFIAACAPTIEVLIAGRGIQGLGGGVMPIAYGIVRDEFPRTKVPTAISVLSSLIAVGMALGIVVAGPLVSLLGHSGMYWVPFVVTSTAAVCAVLFVPESPVRAPGRPSLLPAVALATWLVALLLAVSKGEHWGWGSRLVVSLFVIAVVGLVAWIYAETRARTPLVDMRMLTRRPVWSANLVSFLLGFALFAQSGFTPQFIQTPTLAGYGFGATITQSGLMTLPTAFATFGAGLCAPRIVARIGPRVALASGTGIATVGMLGMAWWHDRVWHVVLSNGLVGLGTGFAIACMANIVVAAVPPEQTGVAAGMNANIRTMGGAIGSAVTGMVVSSQLSVTGFPDEFGYTAGFLVLAAAFAVASLASWAVPTGRPSRFPKPAPKRPSAPEFVDIAKCDVAVAKEVNSIG